MFQNIFQADYRPVSLLRVFLSPFLFLKDHIYHLTTQNEYVLLLQKIVVT